MTVKEWSDSIPAGPRFLTVVLWLCAAGALWLLLSPAAFQRRALSRRAAQSETVAERERERVRGLEYWRNGLESDPSVIEREARKLGYGAPDERSYPHPPQGDARAAWQENADRARRAGAGDAYTSRSMKRTVGYVLMFIIAGAVAFLFFWDLRVEEPEAAGAGHTSQEETR